MYDNRILVVGTTHDYIDYINSIYPRRALFLTDESVRINLNEVTIDDSSLIISNLLDFDESLNGLLKHLNNNHQILSGITCFDCEWLNLASKLGSYFNLPYAAEETIHLSRDKYLTKRKWSEKNISCPKTELIHDGWQTLNLIKRFNSAIVLKPLTGSGSEYTYLCHNNYDISNAYHNILSGLASSKDNPLYNINHSRRISNALHRPILAEEYIEGTEYSADFIIDREEIKLIRTAEKIRSTNLPFGTTIAYVVPANISNLIDEETFSKELFRAANALGLNNAVCMVDFIYKDQKIYFLELTPRIGGDCLPHLIRHSSGLDTIELALDFAENKKIIIPSYDTWVTHIGLRLFSDIQGRILSINYKKLLEDPRIKDIYFKHHIGHHITLPPKDYSSWNLGHIIFEPFKEQDLFRQCVDISGKIIFEVEESYDEEHVQIYNSIY